MSPLEIGFIVISVIVAVFLGLSYVKNENTFRNQMIISHAIYLYNIDKIEAHDFSKSEYVSLVDYDDEEDYDDTLKRFWDWGYTRILPPEKYELIKEYIPKAIEDKPWNVDKLIANCRKKGE